MANPAPTINQINAFNATQGTTIDFNIIGGTELVRSNRIYIYDLSDNSLICTHLYVSTESIHELPPNTDGSIVYESGKSSADFVNGAQYYAQIQTFTDIGGTEGGSGLSVAKMFWCLVDPTLTITTIPSSISTTSYNVSATYNANTSVVSNIIQQYQFNLYNATGSLLQSSGVVVGNGEQQGTSTAYDISYNFTGLSVGSSYYVVVDVTTTQGMSVSAQSSTFTVSIDTPTVGGAIVNNNACDGYISVVSNLSDEYGGSGSGDIVSFETDSENVFTKLQVAIEPTQSGSGTPSPSNVRPIYGVGGVEVDVVGKNLLDKDNITWTNAIRGDDGTPTASTSSHYTNAIYGVKANAEYTISGTLNTSISSYRLYFLKKDGTWISRTSTHGGTPYTFTTPNECEAIQIQVVVTSTITLDDVQLEQGTTATEYEPYQGQTISQEFDVSLTPTSKDTDPYLFKAVGDIYGDRLEEELVGGSVAWNQLVQNGNFADTSHWWAYYQATINGVSSGVLTFTVSGQGGGIYASNPSRIFPTPANEHKYFATADIKLTTATTSVKMRLNGGYKQVFTKATTDWQTLSCIYNLHNADNGYLQFGDDRTSGWDAIQLKNVMAIDLTAMFGSTIADYIYSLEQATAGAGVAWFKKLFPKPYYAYNAGELMSVQAVSHDTVGFNAWDEEWEVGAYSVSTGQKASSSANIRNKNIIRVLPNTTYYAQFPSGSAMNGILFYDADKNYLGSSYAIGKSNAGTFTTPTGAYYLNFQMSLYGTTYNHDICINLSKPTGTPKNGDYVAYEGHSYPLDSDLTLRGIPKLDASNNLYYDGDVYESDGTVTRKYGVVDLGTLTWSYTSYGDGSFYASVPTIKKAIGWSAVPNIVCSKYKTGTGNDASNAGSADKVVSVPPNKTNVIIKDLSYGSDATAFKTAMSGVYLVYELATPTTETAEPFADPQVCSIYGTEEFVDTREVPIPVGHVTTYKTRDVFGGYIDLVSGLLTVTHGLIDFPTTGWMSQDTYTNTKVMSVTISDMTSVGGNNVADVLSDQYPTIASFDDVIHIMHRWNSLYMFADKTQIPDVNAWQNYLSQLENKPKVLYPLATPLTYQLTPHEIETLVGTNNVWSEQGDIELSYHIPITDLLVKRQDVDDVSGTWLTLYSQPITQASDMNFTFIDFLNQYGKTYKYALVPLLTQTQSGVEVEVEGGYTVSDEVQSIFDGVFISDSTGSHKCKANVGYGNVNMNQSVGSITPIGSQYPIIVTNSNNRYHNGSISGMIVPDDYYYNGNLSRIDMVNKRNELEQFLTNKRAKIIKDWNSNIWLVMIMDNIDCSFDNNYGMGIVTFNANWLEVGDPTNQQDLQDTGLINVGGV